MKKLLPASLRSLLISGVLLLMSYSSFASHIVAAELRYKWVSGLTYQVTVYLYGDCGPSSTSAFGTLPYSAPQVCYFDGATPVGSLTCSIVAPTAGVEVTPVCPDSLAYTQCTNVFYSLPGIKKFVYTGTVTLPHTSANWRFVYEGNNGAGAGAGRAAAISNINTGAGSFVIQLIDTLNNSATNTRGNNSSPVLTVEPIPYFCGNVRDCYNPGAVDLYDVSPSEPAGDSLVFSLIPATNGTSGCASVGGAATYITTVCPGGPPTSGANPLTLVDCTSASFSFDPATGQLCFVPVPFQRSVVVYNIDEYRNDTVSTTPLLVNKVMVGSLQREMTFLVKSCTTTSPTGGIDSAGGAALIVIDSFHARSCANSGTFSIRVNPTDASTDTSIHIDITATGLSAGFTFSVVNNGTHSPVGYLYGNTSLILPGHYVIYITYTDNHCPIVGTKTYPFTFDILPVPSITDTVLVPATCTDSALVQFRPGGTGKPWTIKLSRFPSTGSPLDTFRIFSLDTSAFTTHLVPGRYIMTIFTAVSNDCNIGDTFRVDTPHFNITDVFYKDPTYCGARDGKIYIAGLNPNQADTLIYRYYGVVQPHIPFVSSPTGTDTLSGLLAGYYDSIVAQQGYCFTNVAVPNGRTLVNPPFIWRTVTTGNATKCGFCNGTDTLWGIHPGQLDTISYSFTPKHGVPTTTTYTISRTIGLDSMVTFTGLCAGNYTSFLVKTAGVCSYAMPGSFVVDDPDIKANFDNVIHYGCNGDTVFFNNHSYPNPFDMNDSILTYKWLFGDGATSTVTSPEHLYNPTNNTTFNVKLTATNGVCIDSDKTAITLNNFVVPGFTLSPSPYVCQGSPVTFTNTSTGTNLSYEWFFGDGTTDVTASPTHSFASVGTYKVKLVASDHVLPTPTFFTPCYDTAYHTIIVDSLSAAYIQSTDSVICLGQAIDFNGVFARTGDTLVGWTFGDGNGTVGINPIVHSFEETGTGTYIVNLDVKFRACPETTATKKIWVYGVPNMYLGPDTAMCPGSNAIVLKDEQNADNTKASWKWSTGETGSAITVVKPGEYWAKVTVNGCSSSDTIEVRKDCYVDIPNVFTPNNDGVNDYFFPRQLLTRGVVQFKMEVYNRWGQQVYETESIEGRGWDGRWNDQPQPEGVYVYLIDVKFKDGQIEHHQGNITLLR